MDATRRPAALDGDITDHFKLWATRKILQVPVNCGLATKTRPKIFLFSPRLGPTGAYAISWSDPEGI